MQYVDPDRSQRSGRRIQPSSLYEHLDVEYKLSENVYNWH